MKKALKIVGLVFLGIFVIVIILQVVMRGYQGSARRVSDTSDMMTGVSPSVSMSNREGISKTNMMGASYTAPMMEQNSIEDDSVSSVTSETQIDKKIIKNGSLSLKVGSADEASEKIHTIAKNNNGEVFASNFHQSVNNVKSGTITVKVPVVNFEKTFGEIKTVASLVIEESTTGQDVTEQYTDLEAQLRNAQAEEQTFVKILDQAVKIDDVLAVTRELARVRGTIERLQGSMKYLASQTDMSTISVNLTENQNITTVSDSWRPFQVMKDSVNALITGLQGFVDFLIRFIISLLPFFILWGIIIWILYKIGRKLYQKLTTKNE